MENSQGRCKVTDQQQYWKTLFLCLLDSTSSTATVPDWGSFIEASKENEITQKSFTGVGLLNIGKTSLSQTEVLWWYYNNNDN